MTEKTGNVWKPRNFKDNNEKTKENNRKSVSAPEFPPFCHDFDEVLSDKAVVKLPEVKQIGYKSPSSICGESVTSEEIIDLPFSLAKKNDFSGEWNKTWNDLCWSDSPRRNII